MKARKPQRMNRNERKARQDRPINRAERHARQERLRAVRTNDQAG